MRDQFNISQSPATVQLSHKGTEQWAIRTVLPGLQKLAESGLRDFYALERASKQLPKILHPRWSKHIEELKATTARMLVAADGSPASVQRVFIHLLKIFNERWFIDMGLFLARYPVRQGVIEGDSLWDRARVAVHRIVQVRRHRFFETEIPVYFLECYPRKHPGFAGVFDGVQGLALVSLSAIRFELVQYRMACGLPLEPWEAQMIGALSASDVMRQVFACFAEKAVSLFPVPQRLFEAVLLRTLVEELRHAIDGFRIRAELQRDCSPLEYYQRFGALKLAPQARSRSMWNDLEDFYYQDDLVALGKVTSELSAQMTALAVGSDPRFVLAEWCWVVVCGLQELPDLGYLPPHAGAALLGACLISEEMGLDLQPSEVDLLASWLKIFDRLADFGPERIRLAAKTCYAREFLLGEIDEPPFQRIDVNGALMGTQDLLKAKLMP